MLEVLSEDYVRTARAKGVPARSVVWRHALRNALIPIITVVGLYLSILIGNSVLTEIVFSRPGLGKLIVGALNQRDYTMLQGMMVIYTLAVVLVNLLVDIAYGFVDPGVGQPLTATLPVFIATTLQKYLWPERSAWRNQALLNTWRENEYG